MIALICFVLAVLASPFKSKSRLEAENAALRHQLIVLRRKVRSRARLTNNDRWFLIQLYRLPSALHHPPEEHEQLAAGRAPLLGQPFDCLKRARVNACRDRLAPLPVIGR